MPYKDKQSEVAKMSNRRGVYAYRAKRKAEGRCTNCGGMRERLSAFCNACRDRRWPRVRKMQQAKYRRDMLNPEKKAHIRQLAKERAATYRPRIKAEMIAAYGGSCACCGETGQAFLSIDHILNDGRVDRAKNSSYAAGGSSLYSTLKRQGWPKDRYQLLCMNCNFAKRFVGECPHQKEPEYIGACAS